MRLARFREPLIDGFGRTHTYLRISITDRCNLRCLYCVPPGSVPKRPRAEILTFGEITRLARLFAAMGITKVRRTGGDPLVRRDVDRLVRHLTQIDGLGTLALTTNGIRLAPLARRLKAAGLTHINVSLDTLRPDRFERIARRGGHGDVMAGIEAAMEAGFVPLKLNVVVLGGVNEDEILDFVELARDKPLTVRFIEHMPFGGNAWRVAAFVPYAAMRRRIEERYRLHSEPEPVTERPVAKIFRIEGLAGAVGFITPVTDHFCRDCTRLRLTADGALKVCLFDRPAVSLRPPLRSGASDEQLAELIRQAVAGKRPGHSSLTGSGDCEYRTMTEIGG